MIFNLICSLENISHAVKHVLGAVGEIVNILASGHARKHENGVNVRLNTRDDVGVHSVADKCDFINAVDYTEYTYNTKRPWDEQNADGRKKGEFFDKRFTAEKGLGDRAEKWHMPHRVIKPFGGEKGDEVSYTVNLKNSYDNAVIALRYRTSDIFYEQGKQVGVHYINSKNTATFMLNGKTTVELTPSDEPKIIYIHLGKLTEEELKLSFVSLGTGAAEFDFLAVTENTILRLMVSKIILPQFLPP